MKTCPKCKEEDLKDEAVAVRFNKVAVLIGIVSLMLFALVGMGVMKHAANTANAKEFEAQKRHVLDDVNSFRGFYRDLREEILQIMICQEGISRGDREKYEKYEAYLSKIKENKSAINEKIAVRYRGTSVEDLAKISSEEMIDLLDDHVQWTCGSPQDWSIVEARYWNAKNAMYDSILKRLSPK